MTKKVLFFNKDNEKVWKSCTICGLAKEIKYLNRKAIINN